MKILRKKGIRLSVDVSDIAWYSDLQYCRASLGWTISWT